MAIKVCVLTSILIRSTLYLFVANSIDSEIQQSLPSMVDGNQGMRIDEYINKINIVTICVANSKDSEIQQSPPPMVDGNQGRCIDEYINKINVVSIL